MDRNGDLADGVSPIRSGNFGAIARPWGWVGATQIITQAEAGAGAKIWGALTQIRRDKGLWGRHRVNDRVHAPVNDQAHHRSHPTLLSRLVCIIDSFAVGGKVGRSQLDLIFGAERS